MNERPKDVAFCESTTPADTLREAGTHLREAGVLAAEAARAGLHQVKHAAADRLEQGMERAKSWEQDFEAMVERHPLRAVLIAAGAGLLLGLVARRG